MGLIIVLIVISILTGSWGSVCLNNSDCKDGMGCFDGECKSIIGGICQSNDDCVIGTCIDGNCSNNTRNPKKILTIRSSKKNTVIKTPAKLNENPSVFQNDVTPIIYLYSPERCEDSSFTDRTGMSNTQDIASNGSTFYSKDSYLINRVSKPSSFEKTERGGRYQVSKNEDIIDVINYSDTIVYLYKDGTLSSGKELHSDTPIATKLRFSGLAIYDGYLIGLSNGKIYNLDTDTYENSRWKFIKYLEVNNVERIGSTLSGEAFYYQTKDTIMLITSNGTKSTPFPSDMKRVYGYDVETYIDINLVQKTAVFYPSGKKYEDVLDAVIDTHGNVITLTVSDGITKGYSGLKMVNWNPYHLKM